MRPTPVSEARLRLKAAIVADQAAIESATLNLGFCSITSLVDGIAGTAQAQIGDLLGPGGAKGGFPQAVGPASHNFTPDITFVTDPTATDPSLYINDQVPQGYRDTGRYSTPAGLNLIMR